MKPSATDEMHWFLRKQRNIIPTSFLGFCRSLNYFLVTRNASHSFDRDSEQCSGEDGGSENVIGTAVHVHGIVSTWNV